MAQAERADYSRLREGLCPVHGTILDRRDDHGWCGECGIGWSMTPGTISTHFEISALAIDGRQMGPARGRFTRDAAAVAGPGHVVDVPVSASEPNPPKAGR